MARSRHVLPRRPLDRLPFSPSVEVLRRERGFDDTIKLSPDYLSSLDGDATELDSDSASIAESEPELTLSASSSTSQDPATAPIPSSTIASASATPVSSSASTPTSTSTSTSAPNPPTGTAQAQLTCCNTTYLSQSSYTRHRKTIHHEHQDTDKLCGVCGKWISRGHWPRHLRNCA